MKSLVNGILKRLGYRIVRNTAPNRFQAIEDSLLSLAHRGYRPRRVIDCGANVGSFARYALQLFPEAALHAIEPQPGCQPDLKALAAVAGDRVITHAVALCEPSNGASTLILETDDAQRSTGAHVITSAMCSGCPHVAVPCSTLDAALALYRKVNDQALLKLDVQGYELQALRGAAETLVTTDVVLCEISFFAQAYEPPIAELVGFLSLHGFDLYDVASIYARPRDDRPRQGDFVFVRRNCSLAADRSWD